MMLIVTYCASILSASPGCIENRASFYNAVTPQSCVMKAQEHFAESVELRRDLKPVRWRCERKHG